MMLSEKYRPQSWGEVVGQDRAVARIRQLASRGLAGRAYWISGQSGQGKTTMARLLAAEVACEWDVEEYDGQSLTLAVAKELDRSLCLKGLGGKGRAVIVNEAHGLRKDVIRYLLVALERIPAHAMWVFTTTISGQRKLFDDYDDAPAFLSRCLNVPLATHDLMGAFAIHAMTVARQEGLDGRPLADYIDLAKRLKANLRAMLLAVEAGEMLPAPQEGGEQ